LGTDARASKEARYTQLRQSNQGQIRLRMWHARNKRVALSDRRPCVMSKNQERNDKARREAGLCLKHEASD